MRKALVWIFGLAVLSAAAGSESAQRENSPAACLQSIRDYMSQRMKAEREHMTAELFRAIQKEKSQRATDCAAGFSVDSIAPDQAMDLADLYAEAGQSSMVAHAITKGLSDSPMDTPRLARLLAQAVTITMKLPASTERNDASETYVARIDQLPDVFSPEKIKAHARMNSYYRAEDIDQGIIAHSTRLIALGGKLDNHEREAQATPLITAYANLAEAYASLGQHERALQTLRRAPADLAGISDVEKKLNPYIQRYLLIGRPADPIEARTWLHAQPGTERYDPKGAVTLLQFTAHWCGPCRKSYPAIAGLQRKYADRGLKVVMVTQLFGFFQGKQNISAEEEIRADQEYFEEHLGKDIRIAVADPPVAGKGPEQAVNVNEERYKVGGIPQVHIIDRKGVHRLVMVGFDPSNEERVGRFIEGLLKEPE